MNASKSTGPKTPEGKAKSKLNATRHGLTGQVVVLPSEDFAAYERFSKAFFDQFEPANPMERQFVQMIVDCSWKLNRARAWEDNILALDFQAEAEKLNISEPQTEGALVIAAIAEKKVTTIDNLSRYTNRIHRQLTSAYKELRQMQADRKAQHEQQLQDAAVLLELHKSEKKPFNPSQYGFVLSVAEIEHFVYLRKRVAQAVALPASAGKRYN